MPNRYWWVILTYIIMQLSVIVALPIIKQVFPNYILEATIYYQIISFAIAVIIVLRLMKPDMKMAQTRNNWFDSELLMWSILGVFMAYFAQAIAVVIETFVLGITPGSENTQGIMEITRTVPLFAIVPAIFAPILEEVIFRKIIFGSIYKRSNFFIAALLSAFIFGIIHGEVEHILIYSSMGFVFAFLYVKTKRIIVPILVHMTLNTMSVILQYSVDPEEIDKIQQQWNQMQMILIGG